MDWDSAVKELTGALGRYYTNPGELDLELTAALCALPLFDKRTYTLAPLIIKLWEEQGITQPVAERHIAQAIKLGFLYISVPRPKANPKDRFSSTAYLALTPLGRSCRGAVSGKLPNLVNFILSYALLEKDFDVYGLLLKRAAENNNNCPAKEDLAQTFNQLMAARAAWLDTTLPPAFTRQRRELATGIKWLTRKKPDTLAPALDKFLELNPKTLGQYFGQRIKCAQGLLGHMSSTGELTPPGAKVAAGLPSTGDDFWLAPPEKVTKVPIIKLLKISEERCGPAWRLLRPAALQTNQVIYEQLIEETANFMRTSFKLIKMGMFNQSSLDVVAPYLYWREQETGGRVNEKEFFQALLRKNRDILCLIQPKLAQSHFHFRQ